MDVSQPDLEAARQEVLDAVAEYQAAPAIALARRDERLRRAAAAGLKQVDIVKLTGYSRETVRQALNPKVRAAVKASVERRNAERPTREEGRASEDS